VFSSNKYYTQFSRDEARLPMAALGVIVGIFAGLMVNLFRFVLEEPFPFFFNGLHHDDFESLPSYLHFALPVAGCLAIGFLLNTQSPDQQRLGVAFNTPIAGVIFAMEVILMEYAITGIIPVIVAAVSGIVVSQVFYGDEPVFMIESVTMNSLSQLPWVVLMGLVIGVLASIFIRIHKAAVSFSHIDLRLRLLFIGLMTGSAAFFIPEVMGTGYDSLNDAMQGNLARNFLLILLAMKLVVTAVSLGLGLPGGAIGSSLMLGGIAGAFMGIIGEQLIPGTMSSSAFYVLIGMCAMMGATLQAPLAALMALLELSDNPNIILPAMLIIVVANLTSLEFLGSRSVFQNTLKQRQSSLSPELSRFLNRYGVSTVTSFKFTTLDPDMDRKAVTKGLESNPDWIIIDYPEHNKAIISRTALRIAMENEGFSLLNLEQAREVVPISMHATLLEALETLTDHDAQTGYVVIGRECGGNSIAGVVTRDDIMKFYKGS
jgi:CIC family chloride channel protein